MEKIANQESEAGEKQTTNRSGNFSLVMRKLEGKWKIIHDHSSTLDEEKGWLTTAQAQNVAKSHFEKDAKVQFESNGHVVNASSGDKSLSIDRKTGEVKIK